jgi:hypothetical protein
MLKEEISKGMLLVSRETGLSHGSTRLRRFRGPPIPLRPAARVGTISFLSYLVMHSCGTVVQPYW